MNYDNIKHSSVNLKLNRLDRIYRINEKVSGNIIILTHHNEMNYNSINLYVEGKTNLDVSVRNMGTLETLYTTIKPIELLKLNIPIKEKSGKALKGKSEIPFEFILKPITNHGIDGQKELIETYHGFYIKTQYKIKVEIARGSFMINKNLLKEIEFIVEVPIQRDDKLFKELVNKPSVIEFHLTDTEATKGDKILEETKIPSFDITGKINKTNCSITESLTGEFVINKSDAPIKSVNLQLVRIETVKYSDGTATEATEIQSMQLGKIYFFLLFFFNIN